MSYRLLLTLVLFVFCGGSLLAQDYDLQVTSGAYADLSHDYVFTNDTIAEGYTLNVPFTFRPYDTPFNFSSGRLAVARNGYIAIDDSKNLWAMDAFLGILNVRDSTSAISVELDAQPSGEQILKVQWKNMALTGNGPGDYANFQLWLFDADNSMEVHVGPNHITGNAGFGGGSGPIIGTFLSDENLTTFYHTGYLIGNAASPSRDFVTPLVPLGSVPAAGTIYRFAPKKSSSGAGVEAPAAANGIAFHPNPAAGSTRIALPEGLERTGATLRLYDMLGREALVMNDVTNGAAIAAGQLASGLYYGVVDSGMHHYNTGALIVR